MKTLRSEDGQRAVGKDVGKDNRGHDAPRTAWGGGAMSSGKYTSGARTAQFCTEMGGVLPGLSDKITACRSTT